MSPEEVKQQSEAFIREKGLAINPTLPVIESLDELSPQDAEAVAKRAFVLSHIIGLSYQQTGERLKQGLSESGLMDAVSAEELRLLDAETITEQEEISCSWLPECVQGLAYCLDLACLDPFHSCDDDLASFFPPFTDISDRIASAKLRPFDEIYQQADLHYRLHWAARNYRLTGEESSLSEGIIVERRKALDWVIGVEEDWDEISLDT